VLVEAREAQGVKDRAEMARRLGVAPPQVTRWESGDVEIGESVIRRYAEALGLKARLVLETP
jgi:transcriptional regulator with XRE-family HTH domain